MDKFCAFKATELRHANPVRGVVNQRAPYPGDALKQRQDLGLGAQPRAEST